MNWLLVFHVLGAVFIVGPLTVLPMTGLRAIRERQAGAVRGLARTVNLLAWLALLVALLGIGGYQSVSAEFRAQLGTAWMAWSVALTLLGIVLTLAVVVPQMNAAAKGFEAENPAEAQTLAAGPQSKDPHYAVVSAVSGVVSVLFLAVAVLMVLR